MSQLTPELKAKLDETHLDWERICFDSGPLDRDAANAAVLKLYEYLADKSGDATAPRAPKHVVWASSTDAALYAINVMYDFRRMELVPDEWKERVFDILGEEILAEAKDHIENLPKEELSKRTCQLEYFPTSCWGVWDAYWIAPYEFARDHMEVQYEPDDNERLDVWLEVCKHCHWFWPFENVCVFVEAPKEVHFDDEHRLHNLAGPSFAFEDGMKIYAVAGTVVSEKTVMAPETITADEIDAEENIEVRRIMIDQMGIEKYLKEVDTEVVDMDGATSDGGAPRSLLRVKKTGQQFLCGTDGSTKRVYYMRVSPEVKTCTAAHLSISGFDDGDIIAEC